MPKSLSGVVVLDLTRVLAGPYCSMVLADLGAEVIKIEAPGTGDDARAFGPFINGESAYFMSLNRRKKSVTVNLKHPKGRDIVLRLAAGVDVILENYRATTMDRLGIGCEVLRGINPRLIYAATSGFGHTGPYADKPCYDIVAQAMGGVMSITGQPDGPPTRVGASIGDITAGLFTVIGVLAALQARHLTGEGQKIDVSMLDSQVAILENAIARYAVSGEVPGRLGNRHPSISPFSSFATCDGHLILAIGNDGLWSRFCRLVGRPELANDRRFATNDDRVCNWPELEPVLSGIINQRTLDEWIEVLEAEGIPCGPINTVDRVINDPQVVARNMIVYTDHPRAGRIFMPGSPVRLSAAPCDQPEPAPLLGQHTREVLSGRLGLSEIEIEELARAGAI
ncbi:MAG: CoA transferase [Bacillota bacterium]|nr:CoA transferase [Bacillota bacterium]